jgi:drug/metabolite transporter (DMT)-like permease
MKKAGLIIFVVALAIHVVFFLIPRHHSPESIVVAGIGLLGVILMVIGKRQDDGST